MLYYKRVNGNMNLFHGSNILVNHHVRKNTGFWHWILYNKQSGTSEKMGSQQNEKRKTRNCNCKRFSIDDDFLSNSNLNVLNFQKADKKWLDFIMANRTNLDFNHSYDIVKGAVANDRVYASLNAFENGFMEDESDK